MKVNLITGHVLEELKGMASESVHDSSGRIKKGTHWRTPKPFWNKRWLYNRYIIDGLSAADIAIEQGCTENNILYWLKKHAISRRAISKARELKKWGLRGSQNGMYGKSGDSNPNWKGGITPERQSLYASLEWKEAVRVIWKRDRGICQRCNKSADKRGGKSFHVHHIVSFEWIEGRYLIDNLVLICRKCHNFIHSKENINCEFIKEVVPYGKCEAVAGPCD